MDPKGVPKPKAASKAISLALVGAPTEPGREANEEKEAERKQQEEKEQIKRAWGKGGGKER